METTEEARQGLVAGVRIVTTEGLIFQGQLTHQRNHGCPSTPFDDKHFIFVLLNCPTEILFNGTREDIQPPLFDHGDIVKISFSQIIAIGPSGDCIVDGIVR